jgi:hypothetical protein
VKLQKAEVKNDILNLYFGDFKESFKVAFRYSTFQDKMNHIYYDNHLTTAFTNIQYKVYTNVKNKKIFINLYLKIVSFLILNMN